MHSHSHTLHWILLVVILVRGGGLLAVPARGAEQSATVKEKQLSKRPANPAMLPVEDLPGLPRVLLIGDSISIGYTVPVREMLRGIANVHRPLANCGPTTSGLEHLDAWLATGGAGKAWDVIHFNWGLHDLKFMGPNGENLADPAAATSRRQVPPDDYRRNLTTLVERLQKTGAKLIWRNTTQVPEGARGRLPEDVVVYNTIAHEIMTRAGVSTHDLLTFARNRLEQIQKPADVHFTPDGSAELAADVVRVIRAALPARGAGATGAVRPKGIIWIVGDGMSPDRTAHGTAGVATSNLDRLAQ
jgi:hypothetical protein